MRRAELTVVCTLLTGKGLLRTWRLSLAAVLLLLWPLPSGGQQQLDQDLITRSNELLASYAMFKNYPSKDAAATYQNLTEDRRAVFDAIVRAMFVRLDDRQGNAGKRVIDFVQEVRGIWGVRTNQSEGHYMFRLSMLFDPAIKAALTASFKGKRTRSHLPCG